MKFTHTINDKHHWENQSNGFLGIVYNKIKVGSVF